MKNSFSVRRVCNKMLFFLKRSERYGLQARMTTSYVWMTVAIVFVLECLNTALLTGEVSYTLEKQARGAAMAFPPLTSYPLQTALVMFMLLALLAPLAGGWFGTLTTRGLVRRVHHLMEATMQVANGDYAQRVANGSRSGDEYTGLCTTGE